MHETLFLPGGEATQETVTLFVSLVQLYVNKTEPYFREAQ